MKKNPMALDISEDQQRAIETLAGGRIVRLSGEIINSKVLVEIVSCNAPFAACDEHATETACNAPFAACDAQCNAWKISFTAGATRFESKGK